MLLGEHTGAGAITASRGEALDMKAFPRRTWPFSMAGAVMLFAVVAISKAGRDEAVNAIVILGPLAALFGAVLGSVVGGAVNRR